MKTTSAPSLGRRDLERALAVHGGDLSRWPAGLRARAQARLARDPAAAAEVVAAVQLDAALRASALRGPSQKDEAAGRRIAARLSFCPLPAQDRPHPARSRRRWLPEWAPRPAWPSMAVLAGMAALGFFLGPHIVGDAFLEARPSAPIVLAGTDSSSTVLEQDPLREVGL